LSQDELEAGYRKTKDAVERSHWQIVWLLAQGQTTQEIAQVTGYTIPWIRAIVHRYNQAGSAGLGDRRHNNPGAAPILSAQQQADLQHLIDEPPADGGLWSGPKVAAWIQNQTGRKARPQLGWDYIKRLEFSQRVLRPRHAKTDPGTQEAFKKTCPSR
jgi:transposase